MVINRRGVYVKEHPTSQTFEKMSAELRDFVLNPLVPSTNNRHREIYIKHHPEETLTPDDIIHHINGNHDDNRIENLMKVTSKEHRRLHSELVKK